MTERSKLERDQIGPLVVKLMDLLPKTSIMVTIPARTSYWPSASPPFPITQQISYVRVAHPGGQLYYYSNDPALKTLLQTIGHWEVITVLGKLTGEAFHLEYVGTNSYFGACDALFDYMEKLIPEEYHTAAESGIARAKKIEQQRTKAKQARMKVRAKELTVPGQRYIARAAVLEQLKSMVEESALPVLIDPNDVQSNNGRVYVRVKLVDDNNASGEYAKKAFKGTIDAATVDRTGESLYDSLEALGFDMEKLLRALLSAKDEDCRQFAVKFSENIVAGLLDQSARVRFAAQLQKAAQVKVEEPETLDKVE